MRSRGLGSDGISRIPSVPGAGKPGRYFTSSPSSSPNCWRAIDGRVIRRAGPPPRGLRKKARGNEELGTCLAGALNVSRGAYGASTQDHVRAVRLASCRLQRQERCFGIQGNFDVPED